MLRTFAQPNAATGLLVVLVGLSLAGCAAPSLRKIYTEHLGQLSSTFLNPIDQIGITGTDLGVSFVEAGPEKRLIFLFGDSWTKDRGRRDQDSAAWMALPSRSESTAPYLADPMNVPKLNWFVTRGEFSGLRIAGPDGNDIALGGMNVPVEGVAIDEVAINLPYEFDGMRSTGTTNPPERRRQATNYVFTTTGWDQETKNYCCSVLAHTVGSSFDLQPLVFDHKVQTDRFINVSAFVQDGWVWIFGTGPYRRSSVYLARVAPSQIHDRAAWKYFHGMNGNKPDFQLGEELAVPVVASSCIGELSVRPNPVLGYVMLYNCGLENIDGKEVARGIYLQRADKPWGDWARAIRIFHPGEDRGYGYFMHRMATHGAIPYDDGLAEPGKHFNISNPMDKRELGDQCFSYGWRENCWGGEYGPYQLTQWFKERADGALEFYYVMSSWVPYQSHVMRTTLARGDESRPQSPTRAPAVSKNMHELKKTTLTNPDFSAGLSGWSSLGDRFVTIQGEDGYWRLTTYTPAKKNAALGSLHQDFTVDAQAKALRFRVHGGDGTVRLHRGRDIIRETRGRSGHEPRNEPETIACWNIGPYLGETLRVEIFDGATGPWGFIGVTGFEFLDKPCEIVMP